MPSCRPDLILVQRSEHLVTLEDLLGIDSRVFVRNVHIGAVALLDAPLDIVGEQRTKDPLNPLANVFIIQGNADFHPPHHITGHQISRADIDFLLGLIRTKDIYAGVLQIAAYNTADGDVIGPALDTADKAAGTAYQQLDLHACPGGLNEAVDDFFIGEGVHLAAKVSGSAFFGKHNLMIEFIENVSAHAVRCHHQMVHIFHGLTKTEFLEDLTCFPADFLIGRHQCKVGIEGGRFFVVVAGTHLGIVEDAILVVLGDQAELRVHFEMIQTVKHAAAGFLEPARPFDIVLLVKTGAQFNQHRYIFAAFRGTNQRLDDQTVLGDTIERDLELYHIRINGSLIEHGQKRPHAVIGIEEEAVLFPDL